MVDGTWWPGLGGQDLVARTWWPGLGGQGISKITFGDSARLSYSVRVRRTLGVRKSYLHWTKVELKGSPKPHGKTL